MADNGTNHPLRDLLKDPSRIAEVAANPGKFGIDVYNSLTDKNKMYLAFAVGIGLIAYGFTLMKKEQNVSDVHRSIEG